MYPDTVYRRGGSSGYAPYPAPLPFVPPPSGPPWAGAPALFPPRFGQVVTQLTVLDVLRTNRLYPDARHRVSGYAEPGYSGTSTPSSVNPYM